MSRSRLLDVGFGALALGQLVAAAWLTPLGNAVSRPDGTPVPGMCWLHAATGVDCPMCGMTRSFVALAHGDPLQALRFHPAGPLLFVAMIALVIAVSVIAVRRAQPLVDRQRFLQVFQAVAVLTLALGVFNMAGG
jgi:Protein of unknown function (DUF2752)